MWTALRHLAWAQLQLGVCLLVAGVSRGHAFHRLVVDLTAGYAAQLQVVRLPAGRDGVSLLAGLPCASSSRTRNRWPARSASSVTLTSNRVRWGAFLLARECTRTPCMSMSSLRCWSDSRCGEAIHLSFGQLVHLQHQHGAGCRRSCLRLSAGGVTHRGVSVSPNPERVSRAYQLCSL